MLPNNYLKSLSVNTSPAIHEKACSLPTLFFSPSENGSGCSRPGMGLEFSSHEEQLKSIGLLNLKKRKLKII